MEMTYRNNPITIREIFTWLELENFLSCRQCAQKLHHTFFALVKFIKRTIWSTMIPLYIIRTKIQESGQISL